LDGKPAACAEHGRQVADWTEVGVLSPINGISVGGHSERWVVRLGIRTIPWCLAAAGLGIPMLAGGIAGWPYVVMWAILLIVPWIVTRDQPESRRERLVLPTFLLPVLLVLGFIGGWYLIPADVAWFLIEFGDRRGKDRAAAHGRFVAGEEKYR
jgi:hypothetical protein